MNNSGDHSITADYSLRAAVITDLPMIYRGELSYMREFEPASEPAWTRALDRNLEMWVTNIDRAAIIEIDGLPLGYYLWMDDGGKAVLATIHVLPTWRGRGLGTILLMSFISQAHSGGFGTLTLGVHRKNPAQHMYSHAGFTQTHSDADYLFYSLSGLS
ncbi:GNAT family N-acetyltransferase [Paenarthrobacter sp. Z7-10]|uniref:GNAT family N-acetyltransferase n=1 Tax=Paenarthrobacter sp. Z7-10 TaxID=2787635 RepID=UPI0022A9E361|nr:GNAT family N-acetyltransferase [Paenarthrobacter sp. Z7-10]MCZ2402520.1 GNAT family N-acetyltransferase [Paenarthrobacter sp. Z7-10]